MIFGTPGPRAVIFDLDGTLVDSRLDFSAMRAELQAPEGVGLLEYIDGLPTADARSAALPPEHCAYVGDFHFDIEAAERAGMTPVLYAPGGKAAPEDAARSRLLTDFEHLVAWAMRPAP